MKITIDGVTEEMVDGLCRKWNYSETVPGTEEVTVPDPDPEAKEGATITKEVNAMVPNPQGKEDFVKEYVINFITNEYRLVVREDKKAASEVEADAQVKAEVSLA